MSSLSPITLRNYRTAENTINRDGITTEDILDDSDKVIQYIKSKTNNINSQNQYISAIRWIVKNNTEDETKLEPYANFQKKLRTERDTLAKSQKLAETKNKDFSPWEDILALDEKAKETLTPLEYLIYSLYTKTHPVRADYANMVIASKRLQDTSINQCVIGMYGVKFVFNKYKTSEKFGQVILQAPTELANIIRSYSASQGYTTYSKLLGEMTENALSKRVPSIFKKLCDKHITINLLRHSYITAFLSKPKTIKQKEEIALKMLHSYTTQETYAVFSDDEEED